MADFASYDLAENRVTTLMAAGTIVVGHACRSTATPAKIAIRYILPMTAANAAGGWAESTDNATP